MSKGAQEFYAFNRGIVSRMALARLDLKRLAMSAETQTNWLSSALGPMSLRPGSAYLGASFESTRYIPFVFGATDTALIEIATTYIRLWVDDAVLERPAVTAAVSNGTFGSDLTGWTDVDAGSGVSAWATGGYMSLIGDGTLAAARQQQITINEQGTLHALRIVIARGPVTLRIGSTSGGSEYRADTTLGTGTHSLTFTPSTSSVYVRFLSTRTHEVLVDSVSIEASGEVTLPSPYPSGVHDLIRYDQSNDVVYIACSGYAQRKIERRSSGSWSIVLYEPEDGPFRVENTGPKTITPSALTGTVTLTASDQLFGATHVGSLWSLTSSGQLVTKSISAQNTFSDPVEVFGVGEARRIAYATSGTWTATVTLQRSIGAVGSWEDVTSFSANTSSTYADGLDNQIVYYRIGVKTGDYTSGTVSATLNYTAGSITGVVRITAVASATSATAVVLDDLGGTAATSIWAEGMWSDYRGHPSAVAIHDARLFWSGKDRYVGSVTDSYESFDPGYEGDAGPINRTIGFGAVDTIHWLISLGRLLSGTAMREIACRSNSFDEPLTPTNFFPKVVGTQGTAPVSPVAIDTRAVFAQAGGQKVFEIGYDVTAQDYVESDLTRLVPELMGAGIKRIAVQRQPDTRLHCLLDDGTVAIALYERGEELLCWQTYETDGDVHDIVILPADGEDAIYYSVERTIGGLPQYSLERWAKASECVGGTLNKQLDCYVIQTGAATDVVTGLSHLEGEIVRAWGDGTYLGEYTVSGSQITLTESVASVVVGLSYQARWKSTKLGYIGGLGSKRRGAAITLVLADTHADSIEFGPDFDHLDPLPRLDGQGTAGADTLYTDYEEDAITFPGTWESDSRLCLQATAPLPATVLAAILDMEGHR